MYAYSNKDNCAIAGNTSVGQYNCKKYKLLVKTYRSVLNDAIIVDMSGHELGAAIDSVCKVLHAVRYIIFPIINITYNLKHTRGKVNL